jgi:hypothetical protein
MSTNICGPCKRALHDGCRGAEFCDCNHVVNVGPEVIESEPESSDKRDRRHKPDASLKDQQSTGRKRAALAYPLDREAPCEFTDASPSNPKGGGSQPITFGCSNNQEARHHGPDKNTLNNEEGNVHRICHWHHNNWHARNDPDYQPGMLQAD